MAREEQMDFDFGTDELNDPEYETKVGSDATETAPADNSAESTASTGGEQGGAADSTGNAGNEAAPAQQQRAADDGAGDPGKHRTDKDGNLTDGKGNIIAAAGAERRHYERVQQQAKYISRLEKDVADARVQQQQSQLLNGAPAKMGLSMDEVDLGLQVVAGFKKDPVATARWALQETMKMGYTLHQIVGQNAQGQIAAGGLDLAAVKTMINEAVHPLVGDRDAQVRQQELQQSATRDYEAFIAKHENSSVHESAIAGLLRGDPSLTPEVAYWQLREYAAKNGYDFNKPLREQVLARQQGGQRTNGDAQTAPQQAQQPSRTPMPNGGNTVQTNMRNGPVIADADDSWDNIVRQSLAEAGMLN